MHNSYLKFILSFSTKSCAHYQSLYQPIRKDHPSRIIPHNTCLLSHQFSPPNSFQLKLYNSSQLYTPPTSCSTPMKSFLGLKPTAISNFQKQTIQSLSILNHLQPMLEDHPPHVIFTSTSPLSHQFYPPYFLTLSLTIHYSYTLHINPDISRFKKLQPI